jgi:hypothetical protein
VSRRPASDDTHHQPGRGRRGRRRGQRRLPEHQPYDDDHVDERRQRSHEHHQHGGGPGSGGGPAPSDCYDDNATLTFGGYSAPTQGDLGLCTPAQIDQAYAECLGPSADEASCTDFQASSSACSECLFTSDEHWLPLVAAGDLVVVNVAACEALEQNKLGCTDTVAEAFLCLLTTCGGCTSASDQSACFSEAEFGICSTALGDVTPTCESVLNGNSPACGGGTFQALFDSVATRICGG